MRILDKDEVEAIIAKAKVAPDSKLDAVLDELKGKHPGFYRIIYGAPLDAVSIINKDMSNLYLKLSVDVVLVFRERFGKSPEIDDEEQWALTKLWLIESEFRSITKEVPVSCKFGRSVQELFVKNSFEPNMQLELLNYLDIEVRKYASFDRERAKTIYLVTNLLFVLVRLIGDLYSLDKAELE